jgi:hypothetical protein
MGKDRSAKVIMNDLVYGARQGSRQNKGKGLTSWNAIGKYG